MKSYFLITSYTGGNHAELKSSHLIKFLQQIKKYIPDSFIIVIDSIYSQDVEKYCEIFVYEKDNFNIPHGTADLKKTKLGLSILEFYGAKYFTKLAYDFWFNANIYNRYLEWQTLILNKKIVSSTWKLDDNDYGTPNSMAFNFGVYEINAVKKLLYSLNEVRYPIETQLYEKAISLFNKDDIYLYPHFMSAFNEENFDIFNNSGDTYSKNRLEKTSIE